MKKLFGTNGIRGRVGKDLTPTFAMEIGLSISKYLKNQGTVIIGNDSRVSAHMLKCAVMAGLMAGGCDVIDAGLAPSPALQYAVPRTGACFGVIITASHNPPEYNGIKCVDATGMELARTDEEKIERIYFSKAFTTVSWDFAGRVYMRKITKPYIDAVVAKVDKRAISHARLDVVLDCANGATAITSPYVLEKLGCRAITLNSTPQGGFPGHGSEPTPENLMQLSSAVREFGADLGVAHDGDGDRAIFVDERGEYIFGDKTLAIIGREIVKEKGGGKVVTGVSTSRILERAIRPFGGEVVYTKVGSPVVSRKIKEINAVFGGEENGGLIFPEHQYCRDGAMTIAKVLEILAKSKRTLSEFVKELPHYYQFKTGVPCSSELKAAVMEKIKNCVVEEDAEIIDIDGLKLMFEDSWVLIRPSGTEDVIRVYSEAKTEAEAKNIAERYCKIVKEFV